MIKLCQALQVGKENQQIVSNTGTNLCRMSQFQKNKQTKNTTRKDTPAKNYKNDSSNKSSCGPCGSNNHTSRLNVRRNKCQAFQETCSSCGVIDHFCNMCKGGGNPSARAKGKDNAKKKENPKVVSNTATETETTENNSLSGSWFLAATKWPAQGPLMFCSVLSVCPVQSSH